jgi:pimeloyl-ACP methyl ester carboxylesterase
MAHFARAGWRCISPDMRGYGGSSTPANVAAYTVRESSTDMVELHDALGGSPAIWVGHDWGAPVAWTMASHHPERCRSVVGLSVTYLSRGHTLPNLLPLVDRRLYPIDRYPVGQWDYWLYYRESLPVARRQLESDISATMAAFYRSGVPGAVDKPSVTASLRRDGGWFTPNRRAQDMPREAKLISQGDFDLLVAAFRKTGFLPGLAWYLNDADNAAFADEAKNFGRIDLPALFLHSAFDPIDETLRSGLAEPMRQQCSHLTEATVASGHFSMLEQPEKVCELIGGWLGATGLGERG